MLLITTVLISIRSVNVVNKTGRIAAGALTEDRVQLLAGVRETARAFVVEWATWNGSPEDYKRRLGTFIKSDATLPDGIQEVLSAAVTDVSRTGDKYRVKVLLHTRRLVPVPSSQAQVVSPVFVPVTRDDLGGWRQQAPTNQDRLVPVWKDSLLCVEVPVAIIERQPAIAGLPVVVPPGPARGAAFEPRYNESPTTEFITFAKQFLELYYSGGSLANFLAPGAKIEPVTGWKLESVEEVRVDSKVPSRAYCRVVVSAPGVKALHQGIYMVVQAERGSYLVREISSLPLE